MNDKLKTLQLNNYNTDYRVTLVYDKCKTGISEYGPWNLYGVEYSGEQLGIFADDNLHAKLQQYGKGTKLVIRRNQDEKGKLEWLVFPQNGNSTLSNNSKSNSSNNGISSNTTVLSCLDDRTKDIHRQVALKIAVISLGQNIKPWSKNDLEEIKHRMDKLLFILDGENSDELPF